MKILAILCVIVGFFFWPLWILAIVFGLLAMMSGRTEAQMAASQDQLDILQATNPTAYEQVMAKKAERSAQENRARWICIFILLGAFIIFAIVRGNHKSTSSNDSVQATPTPAIAESTPSPVANSSPQAILSQPASLSASPESTYIPDPTEAQATLAMNALQDKLNKPHVRSVTYDAKTDSYFWFGPKSGKKMSMKRSQFEAEIWSDYYKNQKMIGGL